MADEETPVDTKPEDAKPKSPFPMTLHLRKSVIANGDETDKLVLREPTAADIERVGNPCNLDVYANHNGTPQVTFDAKIMTQMLSTLASVPPSTIRSMHTKDWNNAAWAISNFFVPDL